MTGVQVVPSRLTVNTSFPPPSASLKAVLGPTNTGKTHFAIERLLAHRTGMIGLPLRLLAREVYQTIVQRVGVGAVALVTGEERIVPVRPRYWVATVEAMPLDISVECLAIDEIQTAADFDRGHVFTDRLLHARGSAETLILGAATMIPLIRKLLPNAQIIDRPRLSSLTYAGSKKITRQPRRSAIVAFSAQNVYAIAELVRRERGGAAVVMGALSPRTRNAQVDLYQNGDVDFLVATDAIGMGLNLDIGHVAFAGDTKFDGHQTRPLTPAEFGQIAGRAGRHKTDGTFGVTGQAAPFDLELVESLEAHDFKPLRQAQWRNRDLDFAAPHRLIASLDETPDHPALTRAPTATDQLTFETLIKSEAGAGVAGEEATRLLWDCAQIPDYRNISPAQHAHLVKTIFTQLAERGKLDTDWIADQVRFCDNGSGDIDTLSNRIRQIRTWTFVANRSNWLEDPANWRDETRNIEDRLSDALHQKLTQRFVDRRTSVLMRHLRDKSMTTPEINDKGEIFLEGHLIGTLEGLRFSLAPAETDAKGIRAAAASAIAPSLQARAQRLAGAPNEDLILTTEGYVRWRGEVVGELAPGDDLFAPRVVVLADEGLTGPDLEAVRDRLSLWIRHLINTQLGQILTLRNPEELDGVARGLAFRLAENLGVLPRADIAAEVKELDQEVRGKLRKLGVKFGAYHIYVPLSLKPAPRELAVILYALKNGGVRQKGVTDLPHIVLSGRTSVEADPDIASALYEVAGFKRAGKRAVRVDILERLADLIRPLIAFDPSRAEGEVPAGAAERNGFRVTVEMTSLLGCAGEDFASVLKSLGYRVKRTPIEVKPDATAGQTPDQPDAGDPDLAQPDPDAAGREDVAATALLDGIAPDAVSGEGETAEAADLKAGAALDPSPDETVQPSEPDVPAAPVSESAEPAKPTAPAEAETAEPGEPQFDEIWFPARHGERPHGHGHGKKPRQGNDKPHAKGQRPDDRRDGKPDGRKLRPDKADRQNKADRPARSAPKKEKPIDPDSPFAALAVLKQKSGK